MKRPPFLKWLKEEVVGNGDLFFFKLETDINLAERSIDLETYILRKDEVGLRILSALERAAARGVRVRLLIDGFGSSDVSFDDPLFEARVYNPLPWRLNNRNHRKTCLVDGRIAWVGSYNITADHLLWNDCAVRVEGAGLLELCFAFEKAWGQAIGSRRRARRPVATGLVWLNDTYLLRRRFNLEQVRRLTNARAKAWVTNAYFVPNRRLLKALRQTAQRGVDVRVLVPRVSDVFFVRWITKAYYCTLLAAGVKIYEYLPSVLHAKTMIVDDWSVVGSVNLNHRSIIHDLEVQVELTRAESQEVLERKFLNDLRKSAEVLAAFVDRRSWVARVAERLAARVLLFLRYWL